MAWVCPKCGHGNLDKWVKCMNCGSNSPKAKASSS